MNLNADLVLRAAAGLAALALVASPLVVAAHGAFTRWLSASPKPAGETGLDDMRTVLELANRLRLAGNADGVALCQKLLDVMLTKPGAKS